MALKSENFNLYSPAIASAAEFNKALQRIVATGKISCGKRSKMFAKKRDHPLAMNRSAAADIRRYIQGSFL